MSNAPTANSASIRRRNGPKSAVSVARKATLQARPRLSESLSRHLGELAARSGDEPEERDDPSDPRRWPTEDHLAERELATPHRSSPLERLQRLRLLRLSPSAGR